MTTFHTNVKAVLEKLFYDYDIAKQQLAKMISSSSLSTDSGYESYKLASTLESATKQSPFNLAQLRSELFARRDESELQKYLVRTVEELQNTVFEQINDANVLEEVTHGAAYLVLELKKIGIE